MDIKNLTNSVGAGRANDPVKAQERNAGQANPSAKPAGNDDRVTLTDVLSQARDLEVKSQDVKVDNSERVAALKAAIQDGTYQVNAQRVAEKLVQTEVLFSKG